MSVKHGKMAQEANHMDAAQIRTIAENSKPDTERKVRGGKNLQNRHEDTAEEGMNRAFLTHAMQLAVMPKVDTNDPEQVQQRCMEYFTTCAEADMRPNLAGLALALRISRTTMLDWCTGVKAKNPQVVEVLSIARDIISANMEDFMVNSKINPIAGIFIMRNNHGYTNEDTVQVKPNDALGEAQSPEQIREKYGDLSE